MFTKAHPSRMPDSLQRSLGCFIQFWPLDRTVVKSVTNLSTELTTIDDLETIYAQLDAGNTGIIQCSKFKRLSVGYSVTMKPLCWATKLIDDSLELINCCKQLTKGLCYLKTNKILHRDLRWNNVVYDKQTESYFIIDLEHAALDKGTAIHVSSKFRSNLPINLMKQVGQLYEYNYATEVASFGLMIDHILKINDSYTTLYRRLEFRTKSLKDSLEFRLLSLLRDLSLRDDETQRPSIEQLNMM